MTPDDFLVDHEPQREWQLPEGESSLSTAVAAFDGRGHYPLEVALVRTDAKPHATHIRELWKARHGRADPDRLEQWCSRWRDPDSNCGNPVLGPDRGLHLANAIRGLIVDRRRALAVG